MRTPEFLSHSARQLWLANRTEFYFKYLCDTRSPREPQTEQMAVGSSFDAFVKSALHRDLFGHDGHGEFDLQTIFESQVEEHNREEAYAAGEYVFNCYQHSGRYKELRDMLLQSRTEPRFEFTVQGVVEGVPILGKPDLGFTHRSGVDVVLDFKVKGFYSKYTTSPSKGYRIIRDGNTLAKPSRNNGQPHAAYKPQTIGSMGGVEVSQFPLEQSNESYAEQLSSYSWLLGYPVGGQTVAFMVDEIVAKHCGPNQRPTLRVATHSALVSEPFQRALLSSYQSMWKAIQTGHIFTDMNREASDAEIEMLDGVASSLKPGDFFTECTRGVTYFG